MKHPDHKWWVDLAPLGVGALASFYIAVINAYYEQAEQIEGVIGTPNEKTEKSRILNAGLIAATRRISFLGLLQVYVPIVFGATVTVILLWGMK